MYSNIKIYFVSRKKKRSSCKTFQPRPSSPYVNDLFEAMFRKWKNEDTRN